MDPATALGCATSAFAVAQLALGIYNELFGFIEKLNRAGEFANELVSTIKLYNRALDNVIILYNTQDQLQTRPADEREERIWSNIKESLQEWQVRFNRIKDEIEKLASKLPVATSECTWMDKAIIVWKSNGKAETIQKLESAVKKRMDELSSAINCLTYLRSRENSLALATLVRWLEQHDHNNSLGDRDFIDETSKSKAITNSIMEKCITITRSVVGVEDGSSEANVSVATTAIDALKDVDIDPNPEFDDSTPLDVLKAFIGNYESYMKKEFEAGHYDRAETYQRRMIECAVEYNQSLNDEGREDNLYDVSKLKETLADILERKGDEEDNAEINCIFILLLRERQPLQRVPRPRRKSQENWKLEDLDKKSRYYQRLSKRYSEKDRNLNLAEKYAKRSLKLRLWLKETAGPNFSSRDSESFVEAVKELVEVYRKQLNVVAGDTYTQLYLDQSPPRKVSVQLYSNGNHPKGLDLLNRVDSEGYIHLVSAIRKQNISDVVYFLDQGADPNLVCQGKSPLMYAIDSEKELIIDAIIELCNKPLVTVDGSPILHYAVDRNAPGAIAPLCRGGADVKTSHNGYTPLLYAAKLKRLELVRVLWQNKADVQAKCDEGFTALHHAIMRNHTIQFSRPAADTVQGLLALGVDPNERDKEGKTPLHHAVSLKDEESAKYLLERYPSSPARIDLGIQDNHGRTALMYALTKPQRSYSLAKVLIDNGAAIPKPYPRDLPHDIKHLLQAAEQRHDAASKRSNSSATASTTSKSGRNLFQKVSPFQKT